jgi:murein L,D-transpeptidase YafK
MRTADKRFSRSSVHPVLTILVGASILATAGAQAITSKQQADRILVVKGTHTMTLFKDGQVLKSYKVALGSGGGAKTQAGDRDTPEGEYVIDAKNMHSRFHRALHISYPNLADRERARKLGVSPGALIEIHGVESKWAWLGSLPRQIDWTAGCIAVTNPEIKEIYQLVPVGTTVRIEP